MTTLSIPSGIDFVDGEWLRARTDEEHSVLDPATHEVLQTVARAGADDVDDAVRAACRAGGYEAMREYSREKAIAVRLLNR